MYQAIIVIHILLGLSIIGLILMQQGKGADAGATFGGGASGSVFGAQGAASFLSRTTAILATLFFITSLGLAWINGNRGAAADFMSIPAAEKDVVETGLPNVDGAEAIKKLPTPQAVEKQPAIESPVTTEKPVTEDTIVAPAVPVQPEVIEEKESELKPEQAPQAPVKAKKKK
ncbi:MAG: preprotein translocase subunit SecG [Methylococcaceae bacterium]|nr:preprotein translocase subunit SecG [Methylococcaceae bacterium]